MSFTAAVISSTHVVNTYLQFYMAAFYIHNPIPCGYLQFTFLHVILLYIYMQNTHEISVSLGLGQQIMP
jgi:hypothetical protein